MSGASSESADFFNIVRDQGNGGGWTPQQVLTLWIGANKVRAARMLRESNYDKSVVEFLKVWRQSVKFTDQEEMQLDAYATGYTFGDPA